MPVSRYYKGKGRSVLALMQRRYGAKKGKSVFYATANKRGLTPSGGGKKGPSKAAQRKGGRAAARSRKSPIGRRGRRRGRSKRR